MTRVIGTMLYMAPEVLNKFPYDQSSDMWALGILLYIMLTGRIPFQSKDANEIVKLIKLGKYDKQALQDPVLALTPSCITLVEQLLSVDPKKRPTAE